MAARKASRVAASGQFDKIEALMFDSGSELSSLREDSSSDEDYDYPYDLVSSETEEEIILEEDEHENNMDVEIAFGNHNTQPGITCSKLTIETLEQGVQCAMCSKLTIKAPKRRHPINQSINMQSKSKDWFLYDGAN